MDFLRKLRRRSRQEQRLSELAPSKPLVRKFCTRCGMEEELVLSHSGYDSKTGDPADVRWSYLCPDEYLHVR